MPSTNRLKVTFLMEQHVGLKTYYQNLRDQIDKIDKIESHWVHITYNHPLHTVSRLSKLNSRVFGPLYGRWETIQGLRRKPYDIAFSHTQVPAAMAKRQIQKKPYILASDVTPILYDKIGKHYQHHPEKFDFLENLKFNANVDLFNKAEKFITWSQWAASSLISDYQMPKNKVEVIPVGLDRSIWSNSEKSRTSNSVPRILFIGGDFHRKGGDLVLNAFRSLPKGTAELHIVTRSDIPVEDHVFIYRNMMPNSQAIIDLYHQSDIFVLPTNADSFGIVFLEAMATGLPIIATNIAAIPEIVAHGVNGYLISPNDYDALQTALADLVNDPEKRREMGEQGLRRVNERFDAGKNAHAVANELFNMYGPPFREMALA